MLRDLFSLFPAYAGVILIAAWSILKVSPFPRIRGGDPVPVGAQRVAIAFSPHTRG